MLSARGAELLPRGAPRSARAAARAPRAGSARAAWQPLRLPPSSAESAPLAAGDGAALRVGLSAVALACELTASVQVRVRARAGGEGKGASDESGAPDAPRELRAR